jgi:hypothetical protein
MNPILLGIIGGATLLAIALAARAAGRLRPLHALAQCAVAAGLLFLLGLPGQSSSESVLSVIANTGDAGVAVGLGEAGERTVVERFPDLGSALRAYPSVDTLRVRGHGLSARDRDAARGRAIVFEPDPLPEGIVALRYSARIARDRTLRIDGGSSGFGGGSAELLDAAGSVLATSALDAAGEFSLDLVARASGALRFMLRLRDADGERLSAAVAVPVVVFDPQPLRVRILGGAPGPELKYLRRWALDAGLALDSRIELAPGIALRASPSEPRELEALDVLIVDERAWAALPAAEVTAIGEAVRNGMGLLLRASGPLPAPVARDWRALGVTLEAGDGDSRVLLQRQFALADAELAFARVPLKVELQTPVLLAQADDGRTVAAWRALGRGRVGVVLLSDSFKLVLAGLPDRHAAWWVQLLDSVARTRQAAEPALPSAGRVGERSVACGLGDAAVLQAQDLAPAPLGASDANGCVAIYPTLAGWHTLFDGERRWPWYVRAADDAPALRAGEDQIATRGLAALPSPVRNDAVAVAFDRRIGFALWLLVAAGLWLLERHLRHGELRAVTEGDSVR